jgi:signal peptidase
MKNSPGRTLQAVLLLIIFAALLWMGFGPVQLGGPVSYIIISGNSMEPDFQVGDLVLARKNIFYQLNDQVVYNHPKVGYVFHRIVAKDHDTFILKGDHNDWQDSHQPTGAEVLGKYWFMVPGAGEWIRALRKPVYFTGLAISIAVIIGAILLFPENDSARKKKGSKKTMAQKHNPQPSGDFRQEILFVLGLITLIALAFGLISFTRSLTMQVADDIFYSHQGDFVYTASSQPGIYDQSGIETGDPIYPRLACRMEMIFTYQFLSPKMSSPEMENLTGTLSMRAVVSDPDGWKRTFPLVPKYNFSGNTVKAATTLNICKVLDLIKQKEDRTGTENRWYSLAIRPEIQISGKVAGLDLKDTYSPEVIFDLGQTVLRLPDGEGGFQLSQEGQLPHTVEVDNLLTIFGRHLTVESARRIAEIVLGLCLLGAAYPAWSLYRDWKASSEARIRIQNQPLLVEVKAGSLKKKGQKVIQLSTFADIRKMAERYGALIMHEVSGSDHTYSIEDGTTLYQYILENSSEGIEEISSGGEE